MMIGNWRIVVVVVLSAWLFHHVQGFVVTPYSFHTNKPYARKVVLLYSRNEDSSPSPAKATTSSTTIKDPLMIIPSTTTAPNGDGDGISEKKQHKEAVIVPAFRENLYILSVATLVGILSGLAIVVFKTLIEVIRAFCYDSSFVTDNTSNNILFVLPVVLGGAGVALLVALFGDFAPGLRGTIREVDATSIQQTATSRTVWEEVTRAARKSIGAAVTLGTGNSLGPEGPAVEAGMAVSRFCGSLPPMEWLFGGPLPTNIAVARNRLFLSCGAAAGVAAGFNAPLAGVFFALEIVQGAFPSIDRETKTTAVTAIPADPNTTTSTKSRLAVDSINISPILLSSVIAALVVKNLLGNELALNVPPFSFQNPLLELPIYLVLGALSGILASLFSGAAQFTKAVFDGDGENRPLQGTPAALKPILGSLFCGSVGVFYPQTLFFGYDTLNALLAVKTFPTLEALQLLVAKFMTTTVAAASGLVGGTFAPSLFLGGMLGAAYHNIVCQCWVTLHPKEIEEFISGTPAYTMVGGASVLAALFRAPLTATLLLFECTRNYDVILPLMASAGVASLVADIVEQALEEQQRDDDAVSWGDLAMRVRDTVTVDFDDKKDNGI